jgi:hypothetical protein
MTGTGHSPILSWTVAGPVHCNVRSSRRRRAVVVALRSTAPPFDLGLQRIIAKHVERKWAVIKGLPDRLLQLDRE